MKDKCIIVKLLIRKRKLIKKQKKYYMTQITNNANNCML